jgi:C_GCAxxG_C_C family probable redox protein
MSESKVKKAVDYFDEGFFCSQAIVASYGESLGLNRETALKIAESFGVGIGGMAETCGAVTGALMVIGLKYGRVNAEDDETKEKNRDLVKEFLKEFKNRHHSLKCKALLKVDVSTKKGMEAAEQKDLFNTRCPEFVRSAAEILEQLHLAGGT